ncbi:hypothetical protein F5884DRAFT_747161 [Xylogone sp. PMI_703]|nr:hypothetical protein F5884DRAFT_747161 [Xylogone sp. PMI_703]
MDPDDPWNWDVDRVVKELCTLDRSWQPMSAGMKLSDPESLEQALREQEVYGTVLLTSVDERSLKEDLGLKILGRKFFVQNAIEELRSKSSEYQRRIGNQYAFPSGQSTPLPDQPALQQSHQFGWDIPRPFIRSLPYRLDPTPNVQNGAVAHPFLTQPVGSVSHVTEPLSIPDSEGQSRRHGQDISSTAAATYTSMNSSILDHNESSSKRRRINEPITPDDFDSGIESFDDKWDQRPHQLENDTDITATLSFDEPSVTSPGANTKKRKRVTPTLISTDIDHQRSRDIPTAADTVILYDPANVEPGLPFMGDDGRKRIVPIPNSVDPSSESPYARDKENTRMILIQNDSSDSITETVVPSENSRIRVPTEGSDYPLESGYLGKNKMPVDEIFYHDVSIGQTIALSQPVRDFSQSMQKISSGRRLYVNNRMKHFLRSDRRDIKRNGRLYSAIIPYQAALIPMQQTPSFTLFSKDRGPETVVTREALSSWPEIDPDVQLNKHNIPHFDGKFMLGGSSYDDWDPSLLEKYRLLPGGDEVLPVYGESDEDNEYDYNTWKEINDERNEPLKLRKMRLRKPPITAEEINQAIDEAIQEIKDKWRNIRLPKQRKKAWSIWTKSRSNGDKDKKLRDLREILGRYEKRIPAMRTEILKETWTSQTQVKKQAQIMEPTLFDIQDAKWRISVLKKRSAPQKPSRKSKTNFKPAAFSGANETGEVDYDGTESASSEDDMDNFVVPDDDSSIVSEGELEVDQADSEGTDAESMLSDIGSEEIIASTPRHQPSAVPQVPADLSLITDTNTAMDVDRNSEQVVIPFKDGEVTEKSMPIKEEKNIIAPVTGISEVVDLTIISSDEATPRVNLVTPKKPKKPRLFHSSPIRISDSEESSIAMPNLNELPSLSNPEAIAKFNYKAWIKLRDRKRLLLAVLYKLSNARKTLLFGLVRNMSEADAWSKVVQKIKEETGKIDDRNGKDTEISSALAILVQMFEIWTDCKYHPARDKILKNVAGKLLSNQDKFPELYQFLGSSAALFDLTTDTPSSSALQALPIKEEKSKAPTSHNSEHSSDDMIESVGSSEDLPESARRRRKQRRPVLENVEARNLREQDRQRLAEQEKRRKKLLSQISQDIGTTGESKIIINDGKFEHQGCVYVSENIAARIKKHQIEGVRFMWNQIVANDMTMQGCLLAHSMGLGKTMQVITLLVAIAEAASSKDQSVSSQIPESLQQSKTLIICPPSLINNWMDELLIWAPEGVLGEFRKIDASVRPQDRLGTIGDWFRDGGILVIGYEMFRMTVSDKEIKYGASLDEESRAQVCKYLLEGPNIVVADEAHKMKNAGSEITKAASRFRSKSRIALTGSPLANNVVEYYTMIDWVAPNYLGPITEFRNKYVLPIQDGFWHDSTATERRKALKLLGVLKEDVAPKVHRADMSVLRGDLPPKKEFVITVPLTALQEKAYILYVRSIVESQDATVNQTTLWHWLAILSLLCNHPSCFKTKLIERKNDAFKDTNSRQSSVYTAPEDIDKEEVALDFNEPIWKVGVSEDLIRHEMRLFAQARSDIDSVSYSNKVKILCQILDASKAVGDKVLVFSQSIPTLNYLEKLCITTGRIYARLDGSTPINKRQRATKEFNTGSTELYLISTTAGGLGLNIPGANRVVIFDFKYNPIMEEQAIGRAYRIGQKKKVFVYRLVAGGTFEDGIHNKAVFKTQLASRVVDKKSPVAWAKKDIAAYLHAPKEVEQKDLSEFKHMDPAVLDVILASQVIDSTIRRIVQTDTFEQDDNDRLTAEEQKEVDQLISDAKLQRSNPQEWHRLIQQRYQTEYANRQTAAYGQASNSSYPSYQYSRQTPIVAPDWIPAGHAMNMLLDYGAYNGNTTQAGPPLEPTLAGNTRIVAETSQRSSANTISTIPIITNSAQDNPPASTLGVNRDVASNSTEPTPNSSGNNTVQEQSATESSTLLSGPGRPLSPIMGQNTKSLPSTSETEVPSQRSPGHQHLGPEHHHGGNKSHFKADKEHKDSPSPIKSPSKSQRKFTPDSRGRIQNVGTSKYISPYNILKNQSPRSARHLNVETGYQLKKMTGKLPNRRDFQNWSEQYLVAYLRTYGLSETGNREELISRCEAKDQELLTELALSQLELRKARISLKSDIEYSQRRGTQLQYNPTFGVCMRPKLE